MMGNNDPPIGGKQADRVNKWKQHTAMDQEMRIKEIQEQ